MENRAFYRGKNGTCPQCDKYGGLLQRSAPVAVLVQLPYFDNPQLGYFLQPAAAAQFDIKKHRRNFGVTCTAVWHSGGLMRNAVNC
jgi:hypothetical protein